MQYDYVTTTINRNTIHTCAHVVTYFNNIMSAMHAMDNCELMLESVLVVVALSFASLLPV